MLNKLPGKSCGDIYRLNPTSRGKSGYYVVQAGDRPMFVYCDMELECGGEKGWMKVADLDIGDSCPRGWSKITSPVAVVELLVIMLDVILLNSQLTKFLTVECVE